MPRPYISWSIDQLEALYKEQSGAVDVIAQLKQELAFRTTKRAKRLLDQLDQKTTPTTSQQLLLAPDRGAVDSENSKPVENVEIPWQQDIEQPRIFETEEDDSGSTVSGTSELPDDRNRPQTLSRIRPTGTSGLPQPWIRPFDQELTLKVPPDADVSQRYCAAIAALIIEIKKSGAGQKRYELDKGVRAEGNGSSYVYGFVFTEDAAFFEDAKVEVEVPGRRMEGSIVSISSGRLFLAIGEDLGPVLHRAVILIDATALLEALRDRVEQATKGEIPINRALADATVGKASHPPNPTPIPRSIASGSRALNHGQTQAVQRALTESVTYIWGPPGTGKTTVLGHIVRSAFDDGKRILICSNTNKAVDQVLLRICQELGIHHPAMEGGKVVRLGSIALDKLSADYEDYVTVEGIVERRSADLKARLVRLQDDIARIDARTEGARRLLSRFVDLESAKKTRDLHKEATNNLARSGKELKAKEEALHARISKLEEELANPRRGILGWFGRSEEESKKELLEQTNRLGTLSAESAIAKTTYTEARQRFDAAAQELDRIERQLSGADRAKAERDVAEADSQRTPLVDELREIERKLADLRAAVLKDATILGATCTKTYLSAKEIGQVDMVIVDEASMVLLPMIWFAAGRSRERVVICGDFQQLPPIIQTREQAIFDVLGKNVFAAAQLDSLLDNDPRKVKLKTQHRMHEDICHLIAGPMYGGLETATTLKGRAALPPPYSGTLTIIDTSDLWPFESVNPYFSRFNLMHALLVRNLAWHLGQKGCIQAPDDLAICTPYSAQAKLIRKLLENEGLGDLVQVGTVHSFQGDERSAMLLELPEGYGGGQMIGQFLQGVPPDHVGARLINVAVSRAQSHLLVLANLTYLDRLLPSSALLRGILYEMQQRGNVIRGAELLAMRPLEKDLQGIIGHVDLDLDAKTLGLFDGPSFERAVEKDIARAKDSVVLFSGFITPARVGKLGDLLRLKISQGVKVRCVTRPPHLNGSLDQALGEEALNMLDNIGCAVDGRSRIHEKVVLIDKEIVWHGSLNILSHNHRTDESMTRIVNAGFAEAVATNMSKRHVSNAVALQSIASAENPRCGQCGSRTYYDEGKFGPYFRCEKKCGWTSSLKVTERGGVKDNSAQHSSLPQDGPSCPICGGKTRLRVAKFGPFYGCCKYPQCSGKCKAPSEGGKERQKKASSKVSKTKHP